MGLLDKAKGLYEDHKDQIQQGLDKAKQTVNKASDSVNRAATQRLPNTGTMTPVDQAGEADQPPDQPASVEGTAVESEGASVPPATEEGLVEGQ